MSPEASSSRSSSVEQDQPRNRFNDAKVDRRGRYWAGTMNDVDWDEPSGCSTASTQASS